MFLPPKYSISLIGYPLLLVQSSKALSVLVPKDPAQEKLRFGQRPENDYAEATFRYWFCMPSL